MLSFTKLLIFSLIVVVFAGCESTSNGLKKTIVGVKTYTLPECPTKVVNEWKDLGINTAIIGKDLAINHEFVSVAKKNKIELFLIAPVFYNPDILTEHPEWYAIKSDGNIAKDSWVEFVCPSVSEYQEMLLDSLKALVNESKIDGVSIDFIRHFVFWEMVKPNAYYDSLPQTCFCDRCLTVFLQNTNFTIPANFQFTAEKAQYILNNYNNDWSHFKQNQINSTVNYFVTELKKENVNLKINLHAVPWNTTDFNNGIQSVAAQNIKYLEKYCDYISPMCYHFMVYQPTTWVHSLTDSLDSYAPNKILPSIQVTNAYRSDSLTVNEFKIALKHALKEPSKGVVFWSWEYLDENPIKKKVIKDLCKSDIK